MLSLKTLPLPVGTSNLGEKVLNKDKNLKLLKAVWASKRLAAM
jgi:hypothetical protein